MRIQTIRVVLCHDKVVTPVTVCSPCLGARTSRHSIGGRSEQTSGSITLNLTAHPLAPASLTAISGSMSAFGTKRTYNGHDADVARCAHDP